MFVVCVSSQGSACSPAVVCPAMFVATVKRAKCVCAAVVFGVVLGVLGRCKLQAKVVKLVTHAMIIVISSLISSTDGGGSSRMRHVS